MNGSTLSMIESIDELNKDSLVGITIKESKLKSLWASILSWQYPQFDFTPLF